MNVNDLFKVGHIYKCKQFPDQTFYLFTDEAASSVAFICFEEPMRGSSPMIPVRNPFDLSNDPQISTIFVGMLGDDATIEDWTDLGEFKEVYKQCQSVT